jgi:hypothetical protein
MKHHPYRLRPYHNDAGIDESTVPSGWRLTYADEPRPHSCRTWLPLNKVWSFSFRPTTWNPSGCTRIVPVNA